MRSGTGVRSQADAHSKGIFAVMKFWKMHQLKTLGNLFRIIKENNDAYFPQFSSAGIISLPKYLSIVFHFVMYCAKIYAITKTLSDVEFLSCITRKSVSPAVSDIPRSKTFSFDSLLSISVTQRTNSKSDLILWIDSLMFLLPAGKYHSKTNRYLFSQIAETFVNLPRICMFTYQFLSFSFRTRYLVIFHT